MVRSHAVQDIMARTPASLAPNISCAESVQLALQATGYFSTKSACQTIGVKAPLAPWSMAIWFLHHVPRWAIIEWIAMLGRLSSKDRLLKWGIATDGVCVMQYAAWPKKIVNFCSLAILYSIRVWNHFLHKFESGRDALHLHRMIWIALQLTGGIRCLRAQLLNSTWLLSFMFGARGIE